MDRAKHRKVVLQALSEFQKDVRFDFEEVADTISAESDRGAVVIMGSITEDMLLSRIFDNFVSMSNEQRRNLTRSGGTLSSWADRTNLARALGIINDEDVEILEVLKAMRNACAHSRKHIDFKTAQLKDALFLMLNESSVQMIKGAKKNEGFMARIVFTLVMSFIWGRIRGESKDAATSRVQTILDEALRDAWALELSLRQKRSERPKKARHRVPKGKAP